VTTIVKQMRATQGGQLVMDKVNLHIHEAEYTCWAQLSDLTQCGVTDSFRLSVVSLCELLRQRRTQSIGIQSNTLIEWCWGLVLSVGCIDTSWGRLLHLRFFESPIISFRANIHGALVRDKSLTIDDCMQHLHAIGSTSICMDLLSPCMFETVSS
jgi:hypothetical protein